MIDFSINKIEQLPINKLNTGVYLWVFHANKIPPHIGISLNGLFYSLKVNSKDYRVEIDKILNIIQIKKIACLFVELKDVDTFNLESVFKQVSKINDVYPSCLTPISVILGKDYHQKMERLSELLVILEKNQQIKSFFKLNLNPSFKGIKFYTKETIQQRIAELKDVKRKKYLPQGN